MGRRSSIYDNLDVELIRKLKARLRASNYGPIDEHLKWIEESGGSLSRSALGRFVLNLKNADAERGFDPETLTATGADLLALWEELDAIKERERQILDQMRTISVSHYVTV